MFFMKKEKKRNWKKYIVGLWALFILGVAGVALLFILIARGNLGFMPAFEELENPPNILASEIF
jgi:penicillin-binding protein 1A